MNMASEEPPVRLEVDGDVGVIVIDNPPANALSRAVRVGLHDALRALTEHDALRAGVVIGGHQTFISGADIREFSGPIEQPDLPSVVEAFERCPKPIVAAIDGVALGGGLELALACDARIATARARVGLPEVNLGIIPGSGGTQRLPRLAGLPRAIALIAGGKPITAREAREAGIVDRIVDEPLRVAAVAYAGELRKKRRVSDLPVPPVSSEDLAAAIADQTKRARSNAQRAAIEIVGLAATLPFAAAVAREREVFVSLRAGEEAAALRHLFFAERAARKVDTGQARAEPVASVGVVGAGTMGAGIAAAVAASGLPVAVHDSAPGARERGLAAIDTALADLGRPEAAVAFADSPEALADCDLIIEAVFEDAAVKTAVMEMLGSIAKPTAVLATNTSYLDLDAIAAASGRPERVVGLHFFAPAHRMKLLEVVRGARTSDAALLTGLDLAKRLRKVAVIAGAGEGFIGNRIFAKYRAQAEFLLEEGAARARSTPPPRHWASPWDRSRSPIFPASTSPGACARARPPRAIHASAPSRSPTGCARWAVSAARPAPAGTTMARAAAGRIRRLSRRSSTSCAPRNSGATASTPRRSASACSGRWSTRRPTFWPTASRGPRATSMWCSSTDTDLRAPKAGRCSWPAACRIARSTP